MEILIVAPLVLGALIHLAHQFIRGDLEMRVHEECNQLEMDCTCDKAYEKECIKCGEIHNIELGCEHCQARANWTDNQAVAEHNFELAQEEN